MDFVLGWLDEALTTFLPADIFSRLDVYYNGTILFLGAGWCSCSPLSPS